MNEASKTKTSYYRRLLVARLIEQGHNTVPAIMAATGMPRRTAQDTIKALADLDVKVRFVGANKNGYYQVDDWGAINAAWIDEKLPEIQQVLGYVSHH
ncbi:helix-turn-helix domain-containing protein [Aliagarivorans taiwanensis]|uniref:helix-turn-helix domain-containing protein n=1 Tax=Aliagarivorans taiwanensis TaxID=561966 RepID=UPI000414D17F|nr:helix-turn-helix domain-containing protein [Aliagarivorans taiwanensis]